MGIPASDASAVHSGTTIANRVNVMALPGNILSRKSFLVEIFVIITLACTGMISLSILSAKSQGIERIDATIQQLSDHTARVNAQSMSHIRDSEADRAVLHSKQDAINKKIDKLEKEVRSFDN